MPETDLKRRLAKRFREVNDDHPLADADNAHISTQFVTLEGLCAARAVTPTRSAG